jgi:phage protein D
MRRRTRTFSDISDQEMFGAVAGDHGLTADIGVIGPRHRVLAQLNQSDLAFVRERARALDAELWISDSTLHVQPRSSRAVAPLSLTYGKALRDFRVLADLADQATSVEVTGWDVAGKQALDERADPSVLGGELAGGDSGADVLSSAFGERKETIADAVPHTSAEARARAEATMMRTARRFIVGHGTAESRPRLRVGATIRLDRLGALFDGDFYVTATTILFDGAQGLRTEIEVERGWLGRPR